MHKQQQLSTNCYHPTLTLILPNPTLTLLVPTLSTDPLLSYLSRVAHSSPILAQSISNIPCGTFKYVMSHHYIRIIIHVIFQRIKLAHFKQLAKFWLKLYRKIGANFKII